MRKKVIFSLMIQLGFCIISAAQKKILLSEVREYVKDTVLVKGKVYSAQVMTDSGHLTAIYIGGNRPNELLTVYITAKHRFNFFVKPEDFFLGAYVWIKGVVQLQNKRPIIFVTGPNDMFEVQPMEGVKDE